MSNDWIACQVYDAGLAFVRCLATYLQANRRRFANQQLTRSDRVRISTAARETIQSVDRRTYYGTPPAQFGISIVAGNRPVLAARTIARADDMRPAARLRQPLRLAKGLMLTARKPRPVAETPTPPPAPLTPEQMPPTPPHVVYQNGLLTIDAKNSTLSQVLRSVQAQTGASIEMPSSASNDRVMMQLGPGRPRDVLNTLVEWIQV